MSKQLPSYLGLAVFFVVSFLAFYRVYDYVIDFQSETNDCFFLFGRPFWLTFLDHPAGPVRYAGRFLGQFYHHQWLGALIVSASITCFGLLFHHVPARFGGTASVAQTLLPCVLLLALHASTLVLVQDTLGLCASCGAFLAYLSLRGKAARRVYALAATPILYLLLGVYAWLFVAWVVACEWLDGPLRSGLPFKIFHVLFSIAVPLAAWRWMFPVSLHNALTCSFMFAARFRHGVASDDFQLAVDKSLVVVLSVALLLIPFRRRLSSGTRFAAFRRARPGRWTRVALAVALPVLAVLLLLVRYDGTFAAFAACRRLYRHRQWDALLEKAKENPGSDLRLQFMTNFALYHEGALLDEMFSYPQPWGTRGLVFNFTGKKDVIPEEDDTGIAMYNSDLLYEMGYVNAAFRHAYNSMSADGETYDVLKRMAQCSMANGNYDMAAKYLNLLERTLFHRDFARRYKAILADPDAAEREFGDIRERLPVPQGHVMQPPPAPFFLLLEAKPDNRMALEYVVAWLLLSKKKSSIASICEGLRQFKIAGYASIPVHCQEALLLGERAERVRVDLQGYRYDAANVARVDGFFQDVSPYWGQPDAPEQARPRYGSTYMFYYFFVTTPAETRQIIGARGGFGGTTREE
ncbi:MAG TPA: DUF6057 family protein [Thermoguttaceae bacterium]|nr:DUF6057 family protein [Thermoguttaceae bacterium]